MAVEKYLNRNWSVLVAVTFFSVSLAIYSIYVLFASAVSWGYFRDTFPNLMHIILYAFYLLVPLIAFKIWKSIKLKQKFSFLYLISPLIWLMLLWIINALSTAF